MRIVTHDSQFHADDIFAVATLLLVLGETEVVRSRDKSVISLADYVVDVGMEYNPIKHRYDHHQPGGAGERANGIPYAAFGLVWKEFGGQVAEGPEEADIIDRHLVQSVDAHDNGVVIAQYKLDGLREYTIGDFFYSFKPKSTDNQSEFYAVFMKLVGIAKELVEREVGRAKESVRGERVIRDIYEKSSDRRIVVLEEPLPWRRVLVTLPEPLYVIFPRPDGDWTLRCVSVSSNEYEKNRKPLPLAWAGLEGEELEKVTGVSGAKFAHRARFMASAKTKEDALALAKIALEA